MTDDGERGRACIEDELSLSCHLVLRRNWNGVRSMITLAFAHGGVSPYNTHTHTPRILCAPAHIIAGVFSTRIDSGDCEEVVACLKSLAYMETRQYDTYFASRHKVIVIPSRGWHATHLSLRVST